MSKPLHPKRCTVHAVKLDGRGNAEVRVGCYSDFRNQVEYHSRRVKASSLRFRGLHVEGVARIGFVTSPASAVCRKDNREISCKLIGDTSSESLSGVGSMPGDFWVALGLLAAVVATGIVVSRPAPPP